MVNKIAGALLDSLFPVHCVLCQQPSDSRLQLCRACQRELTCNHVSCSRCALPLAGRLVGLCAQCQRQPPPFSRVVAPWIYEERLAHLIRRWKFDRQWQLTPLLAQLWLQQAQPSSVDIAVATPLHWSRLLHRGCNQSDLLLRALRHSLPGPPTVLADRRLVRRSRRTSPQTGMHAPQRSRNLHGAFTVLRPCDNLRIAIVDDVLTTGATAASLARALLDAGALEVEVWCLARTPAP